MEVLMFILFLPIYIGWVARGHYDAAHREKEAEEAAKKKLRELEALNEVVSYDQLNELIEASDRAEKREKRKTERSSSSRGSLRLVKNEAPVDVPETEEVDEGYFNLPDREPDDAWDE